MPSDTTRHRRSIRLPDYDYATTGAYCVTICTQGRACLFGAIVNGVMRLNEAGEMVECVWHGLSDRYPCIALDEHIIMPNHFHGIIRIINAVEPVGAPPVGAHVTTNSNGSVGAPLVVARSTRAGTRPAPTLGDIVGAFKSMTTLAYVRSVDDFAWPLFTGRLWQRNYYERVIREDRELAALREYLANNPIRWELDENHPARL